MSIDNLAIFRQIDINLLDFERSTLENQLALAPKEYLSKSFKTTLLEKDFESLNGLSATIKQISQGEITQVDEKTTAFAREFLDLQHENLEIVDQNAQNELSTIYNDLPQDVRENILNLYLSSEIKFTAAISAQSVQEVKPFIGHLESLNYENNFADKRKFDKYIKAFKELASETQKKYFYEIITDLAMHLPSSFYLKMSDYWPLGEQLQHEHYSEGISGCWSHADFEEYRDDRK